MSRQAGGRVATGVLHTFQRAQPSYVAPRCLKPDPDSSWPLVRLCPGRESRPAGRHLLGTSSASSSAVPYRAFHQLDASERDSVRDGRSRDIDHIKQISPPSNVRAAVGLTGGGRPRRPHAGPVRSLPMPLGRPHIRIVREFPAFPDPPDTHKVLQVLINLSAIQSTPCGTRAARRQLVVARSWPAGPCASMSRHGVGIRRELDRIVVGFTTRRRDRLRPALQRLPQGNSAR